MNIMEIMNIKRLHYSSIFIGMGLMFNGPNPYLPDNNVYVGKWASLWIINKQLIWANHIDHTTWLVVWTHLEHISQLGLLFPMYGKIKYVPNHESVTITKSLEISILKKKHLGRCNQMNSDEFRPILDFFLLIVPLTNHRSSEVTLR